MLHVPARDIPVPGHLSAEAQAVLGMAAFESRPFPAVDDFESWRTLVSEMDASMLPMLKGVAAQVPVVVQDIKVDGVPVYVITPDGTPEDDRPVYLEIHGGALISGGGECCRAMGILGSTRAGCRMWSVDYRMPPEHPYPAALDDCLTVYRALLKQYSPEQIVVGGGSAGANLAGALLLRARDEGLPLPAGAVLITPESDLTESGDSFRTNLGVDTVLTQSLMPANLLYAAGNDLSHPYLSPLFGDFGEGFPPTLLASGTRDLFLSNTVRMHRALRAAGIPAELHILEAAPHGGFFSSAPEDAALSAEVRRFVRAAVSP